MKNKRYYTTLNITPVKIYKDCDVEKINILKDNKNSIVIYRWVNKINNKTYIGSTQNFLARFYKYYSLSYLNSKQTPIKHALLKYGYSNFELHIVELCNKNNILEREQYYLDLLKPEYNILGKAGSSAGMKHSIDTLNKFSERKVSDKTKQALFLAAKNRKVTLEEKEKLSIVHKGKTLSVETRNKLSKIFTEIRGIPVKVINTKTNDIENFSSLTEAAKFLNVSRTAVAKCLSSESLIKQIYKVIK